jgi:L-threonylcarbamoyladenylate synthase
MERWSTDAEGLSRAAAALRAGRLVGMPTETVYGLAGNALDAAVVADIFAAKQRPTFDPLIVHTARAAEAWSLAREIPPMAERLADAFWPGPLTLVLPRQPGIPDLLSAGLDTLALRVPAHPVSRALIREAGFPLAAPSANRFGRISPTRAEHVIEELSDAAQVAGVVDAGPCERGVESTVVGFGEGGQVLVYRLGALPLEQVRDVVEEITVVTSPVESGSHSERAPGMLKSHYAPRTPLILLEQGAPVPELDGCTGWLTLDRRVEEAGPAERLSESGDLSEAASRLFACMRRLDDQNPDHIVAWKVPEEGLGRAINDRLKRASVDLPVPG